MIEQLRPAQLDSWLLRQAPQPPLLLDVREPWEVQSASIALPGCDVLAIPMAALPGRLHELDAARPVACLCHHGARSQRVAQFLVQQGFERVANIAGGIDAWSLELDPAVPRY